ncbi:MAG: hypothetical protein WA635_02305, partial [Gallionella sp.]
MKFERTFLRGSVARRIFAMFVLAAFLPMLVMAVLTFSQVRSIITEQAQSRLVDTSKDFALAVNQRLMLVQGNLERSALRLREGKFSPSAEEIYSLKAIYSSLTAVGPDAPPIPIFGSTLAWPRISESELAHLLKGESLLILQSDADHAPSIRILQLVDSGQTGHFALLAELNQTKLWGEEEDFPYATGLCMFAENGVMLFCSKPDLEA